MLARWAQVRQRTAPGQSDASWQKRMKQPHVSQQRANMGNPTRTEIALIQEQRTTPLKPTAGLNGAPDDAICLANYNHSRREDYGRSEANEFLADAASRRRDALRAYSRLQNH